MKKNITLFIFLLGIQNALACLNYYHTVDQSGDFHEIPEHGFVGFNKTLITN